MYQILIIAYLFTLYKEYLQKIQGLTLVLSYKETHMIRAHYYVPHRRGGGNIVFRADPVSVGVIVGVDVGVTLSCLHDIS